MQILNKFPEAIRVKVAGEGMTETVTLKPGERANFRCKPGLYSFGIYVSPDPPIHTMELVAAGKRYIGVVSASK